MFIQHCNRPREKWCLWPSSLPLKSWRAELYIGGPGVENAASQGRFMGMFWFVIHSSRSVIYSGVRYAREWFVNIFDSKHAVKWPNIASFSTILAPIESPHSQLLIGAKLVSNGAILIHFMTMSWCHLVCHSFSRPLILGGDRTHDISPQKNTPA